MDEFLKELAALLEKHKVEINAHWHNDTTAGLSVRFVENRAMEVYFDDGSIDVYEIREKINHQ